MKETYCEVCNKMVEYNTIEQEETAEIGGDTIVYRSVSGICPCCGNEVWVGEYHDRNLTSMYDRYRERHGIISRADILKIPEMYDIGKRPLSLLLGWGEQTYTRFIEGKIPSQKYSNTLKNILNSPEVFSELLESNRTLITIVAYRKARAACDNLLAKNMEKHKILSVAEYLILSAKDITRLSLQKALYYAQGFSYALTGTFMFENDCEAWVNGPVYEVVYRSARYDSLIERLSEGDEYTSTSLTALTAQDKEILDAVVSSFLKYSGGVLKMFTHSETPWILARNGAPDGEKTRNIITKDSIKEYFSRVADEYGITKPSEIRKYSDAMFSKNFS